MAALSLKYSTAMCFFYYWCSHFPDKCQWVYKTLLKKEEGMTQPKSCTQSQVFWSEAWHAKEASSLKKILVICI